jgi:stringent starvation protein B
MDNDVIHFSARFGGVSREISVPVENVVAIYARENGQGMAFEVPRGTARGDELENSPAEASHPDPASAPTLSAVPSQSDSVPAATEIGDDEDPDPPKKGGRPTLTRIK